MKRFWSKVQKTDTCWLWKASVRRKDEGYGAFWLNGQHRSAHRVAYEIEHGALSKDVVLAHRCDNPRCVRPSHLFVTDQAGNMADKVAKRRQARGERCGNARLSDACRERIREAVLFGANRVDLANVYEVSRNCIWVLTKDIKQPRRYWTQRNERSARHGA
jgi:hypothetical protein